MVGLTNCTALYNIAVFAKSDYSTASEWATWQPLQVGLSVSGLYIRVYAAQMVLRSCLCCAHSFELQNPGAGAAPASSMTGAAQKAAVQVQCGLCFEGSTRGTQFHAAR